MRKNEPSEPDIEMSRYLLPDGCKDLLDVIRLEEAAARSPLRMSGNKPAPPTAMTEPPLPAHITIPDPVRLADLADKLNIQSYQVIGALLPFKMFATKESWLNYTTAAAVCAGLGVPVDKAGPGLCSSEP